MVPRSFFFSLVAGSLCAAMTFSSTSVTTAPSERTAGCPGQNTVDPSFGNRCAMSWNEAPASVDRHRVMPMGSRPPLISLPLTSAVTYTLPWYLLAELSTVMNSRSACTESGSGTVVQVLPASCELSTMRAVGASAYVRVIEARKRFPLVPTAHEGSPPYPALSIAAGRQLFPPSVERYVPFCV